MKRKEIKKQTDPEKILMKLIDGRVQNVQMLINWSYADLKEMKKDIGKHTKILKVKLFMKNFHRLTKPFR